MSTEAYVILWVLRSELQYCLLASQISTYLSHILCSEHMVFWKVYCAWSSERLESQVFYRAAFQI